MGRLTALRSQREKCLKSRPPAAKLRRDRCSLGLSGAGAAGHGARALTWKPRDVGRTKPLLPALRLFPRPSGKRTLFWRPKLERPDQPRKYPSLSHLAVLGAPAPSLGRPAPPCPALATYKGSRASVRAEPPRRLWAPPNPRQSHGSVFPKVLPPLPRAGSPGSLSRRFRSRLGRLPLYPTFCRLALLT